MFTRQLITSGLRNLYTGQRLLTTLYNQQKKTNSNEIEIPVPWGKVTGQLWGSQGKQPILALHGWQDNAASFSVLAPLIMKNTPVLSIDLPGNGLSSWLPPGCNYSEIEDILLIKRIMKHFGWKKVKIIAHSMSAVTTYSFSATFPSEVQYVITLDLFRFYPINIQYYAKVYNNAVNLLIKLEENMKSELTYSKTELKKKWLEGYFKLDDTICDILMTRGIRQKENEKYVLNRDPRTKVNPFKNSSSVEHLKDLSKLITCPYLVLESNDTAYAYSFSMTKNVDYDVLQIMKQHNKNVYHQEVPGKHHFHLTHAEHVANIINQFLKKYD